MRNRVIKVKDHNRHTRMVRVSREEREFLKGALPLLGKLGIEIPDTVIHQMREVPDLTTAEIAKVHLTVEQAGGAVVLFRDKQYKIMKLSYHREAVARMHRIAPLKRAARLRRQAKAEMAR